MPSRNSYLKRYGMTQDDWEMLLLANDSHCPICGKPFNKKRLACVDHNHKTGHVRGLLCQACNWTIGSMHDNVNWLGNAYIYLTDPPADILFDKPRRHVDAPPER